MAQLGSVSGIAENALTVSGKKNEWSMASARSNCFCASGEHEVLKTTRPSFSGLPVRGSGSAAAVVTRHSEAMAADRAVPANFMMTLLCVWIGARGARVVECVAEYIATSLQNPGYLVETRSDTTVAEGLGERNR